MEGGRHIHYLGGGGFTGIYISLSLSSLCFMCVIHNCISYKERKTRGVGDGAVDTCACHLKPNNLSLIPRTNMVEGEIRLPEADL